MDAAEPGHQHRAVIGVAGDPEDHLDPRAGHRLHQHAFESAFGSAALARDSTVR